MKLPMTPPGLQELLGKTKKNFTGFMRKVFENDIKPIDKDGNYLHWDDIFHREEPIGLSKEEYWFAVKLARSRISSKLPFKSKKQEPFTFCITDRILKLNSYIDKHACGSVDAPKELNEGGHKERFLISSIIEEAIRSSQLEGASTTREAAKKMILSDSKPKDKSQRMIMNNYRAMLFIKDKKDEKLTPELIFTIHRILTEGTLEDPQKAGTLRTNDDDIKVIDNRDGTVLHVPPNADELTERIKVLCDFINKEDESYFIFPIMKSIILHLMIGYDHPFADGNGRTARALFYWSALKYGYWITEFISISQILKNAPAKYAKSYLLTETDDNDATYFIIHQMEVIKKAIENLHAYIIRKTNENSKLEYILNSTPLKNKLNHRQIVLLKDAIDNINKRYAIIEHQHYHGITYETARTDLAELEQMGLLNKIQIGKKYVFIPYQDIVVRLKSIST